MDRELWLKAGENGLLGMNIPEEKGGLGKRRENDSLHGRYSMWLGGNFTSLLKILIIRWRLVGDNHPHGGTELR